uniref:Uncharacterized protein n=1 Tax=Cryptomonas curvata TaxID=233186 RepID=A0A7S0LX93_9CRYP|mmetsp:Transcript_14400/g.30783  ORF Transcript_14400/g.30783 Transcript_14400/m.30783 type:complete len:238 (+) Transcript_14400:14-727(+)
MPPLIGASAFLPFIIHLSRSSAFVSKVPNLRFINNPSQLITRLGVCSMSSRVAAEIEPESREDFRQWLLKNWKNENGVWIIYSKKSSKTVKLTYDEVVEECLCFGWIDGTAGKVDEDRTKNYISPRRPSSGWSAINKRRIEDLLAKGLFHQSGLDCMEKAKESGSWSLNDRAESLTVPIELEKEFDKYPNAGSNFHAFPEGSKKIMLQWFYTAKTEETKKRRIAEIASQAAVNKRAK